MDVWSQLHDDMLVLLGRRFNLIEDYLNFASVCKSWRCAATKDNFDNDLPRSPWLMLAEEEGNSCRQFFSLYNGMILNKRIPKASGKRCMESMGWFITVGKEEGEINLLHPFSGVEIELPHQNTTRDYADHETGEIWTFIRKAVLSASPSNTSDYVLMVIEGNINFLSVWRPGELRWTRIVSPYVHRDIVYLSGKFYAVDWGGRVLAYDVIQSGPTQIVAQLPSKYIGVELYIVQSLGLLFVVVRCGVQVSPIEGESDRIPLTPIIYEDDTELTYGTTNFIVFELNLADGKLTETKDIGDRALFLGANASRSVQASQFPGLKPNHIYFTDDYFESYLAYVEGGGLDMGVFNLGDGTIQPHYEGVSLSPFVHQLGSHQLFIDERSLIEFIVLFYIGIKNKRILYENKPSIQGY